MFLRSYRKCRSGFDNFSQWQHGLEAQMNKLQLAQSVASPTNAAAIPAGSGTLAAAAGPPGAIAVAAGPGGAAAGQAAAPSICGVGIRFAETTSGEFKITQLVPDRFGKSHECTMCALLSSLLVLNMS